MKTIIAALLTFVLLAPSFAEASHYRHRHGYHYHYRHYSHYRTYHYRYWPAFASRSSLARSWPYYETAAPYVCCQGVVFSLY